MPGGTASTSWRVFSHRSKMNPPDSVSPSRSSRKTVRSLPRAAGGADATRRSLLPAAASSPTTCQYLPVACERIVTAVTLCKAESPCGINAAEAGGEWPVTVADGGFVADGEAPRCSDADVSDAQSMSTHNTSAIRAGGGRFLRRRFLIASQMHALPHSKRKTTGPPMQSAQRRMPSAADGMTVPACPRPSFSAALACAL